MAGSPWQRGLPPQPPRPGGAFGQTPPSQSKTDSTSSGPEARPPERSGSSVGAATQPSQKKSPPKKRDNGNARKRIIFGTAGVSLFGLIVAGILLARSGDGVKELAKPASPDRVSTSTSSVTSLPKTSTSSTVLSSGAALWDETARSVVYIEADGADCQWAGSGSIILDGSYVLTNQHVSGSGECDLAVYLTDSRSSAPEKGFFATLVAFSVADDLAVLRIFGEDGKPFVDAGHPALSVNSETLDLGTKIYTLGYPGAGGSTITFTSGDFSGMDDVDGVFYKTTAYMNNGVSGGAALNAAGELIGVPTAGKIDPDTSESLGINLVRPISTALPLIEKAKGLNPQVGASSAAGPASEFDSSMTSESESEDSYDPIFDTCREAKSRGYGPYYEGQDYEYDFYDDRDNDGVVCE
jgi:S1-C subfamily serine protease